MTRAEADDRYRASRRDAFGGSGSPARLTRQHAEDGSFIDGVGKVPGVDAKGDLFCGNVVSLGKRPNVRIPRQNFAQERKDLSHSAVQTIARGEELLVGDGVEASCVQSLPGEDEMDVIRVAGVGWWRGC